MISNYKYFPIINYIIMKPLFKWSGGKSDEIKHFKQHFPETFDTYLEPFAGGAAVLFHLKPQKAAISDLHSELIDFYQAVSEGKIEEIYDRVQELENTEECYYNVRDRMEIRTPFDNAVRFYYLRKTCYRGMLRYNKSGKFNIPFGKYKTYNNEILKEEGYTELMRNTEVTLNSFEYMFEKYDDENNFMFLDPPYDSEFTDYGYCKFGKEHHKKLAECFKNTKIKCLMVIGKTDFIEELYKDYIVEEFDKKYRFKLHSGRVGSEIDNKHLIIKNY